MKFYLLIAALVAVFLITSCEDDDSVAPIEKSQIIISPETISINDKDTAFFYLSLQPESSYHWEITSKPAWLHLSDMEGSISDKIIKLKATVNPDMLQTGYYSGILSILTDGAGVCKAQIDVYVQQYPQPLFAPELIQFDGDESEKQILVLNKGKGALNGVLSVADKWINLSHYSVSLAPDKSQHIQVSIDKRNLDIGSIESKVTLYYNNYTDSLTLPITADIKEHKEILIQMDTLRFDFSDEMKSFTIQNVGNVDYQWVLENSNKELECNQESGTIAKGTASKINVTVDRSNLVSGYNHFNLVIKNTLGLAVKILPVRVKHYLESKWSLSGYVEDAEYSKSLDRLVLVTSQPNELRICDTEKQTMTSVQLSKKPSCISISPNGKFAAVGHDAGITYFDLENKSIIAFHAITADCFDIVMSDDKWAYASRTNGKNGLACINLETGEEYDSEGKNPDDGETIRLHPSGKYIYAANQDLHPSDMNKYEIVDGKAKYLYNSSYHGEYPMDGNFWYIDNGQRLITKGKIALRTSDLEKYDLKYGGYLEHDGTLISLDYSFHVDRICAVFETSKNYNEKNSNVISIFHAAYLTFSKDIKLPDFAVPDGNSSFTFYKSETKFCFFNSEGSKFIVIMQAEEGFPSKDRWAIYTNSF